MREDEVMNTATIVHVKPNHMVPEDYLTTVLTKMPTAFGFAGREKDGRLVCETMAKAATLADLKELQTVFKDQDLILYFGNLPKAVLPDDIQPWSFNDGAEDPTHHLIMFFEGNFKKYDADDGHTAEYGASNEVIFPRLQKAWDDANQDLPKFFELLRDTKLQKALCNTYDTRGSFVLLPEQGDLICFGENDLGGQFEWGETTNTLGWLEKYEGSPAPVTAPAPARKSFLRGSTATVVTPKPAEEPAKPPAAPQVDPPKKEASGGTKQQMFPPPKLEKGSRNLWLRMFNGGDLPPNHQSKQCSVWVESDLVELAKRPITTAAEAKKLEQEVVKITQARPIGNVKAAEAAAKVDKPIIKAVADYLPVMSDKSKEYSMTTIAAYLDPKNEKRPSPLDIQKMESKWPAFSESVGCSFEELLLLPVDVIKSLCGGDDKATMMVLEFRRKYIEKSGVKLEDLVKKPDLVTERKAEAELVKEALAPAPARKSWLRGAA